MKRNKGSESENALFLRGSMRSVCAKIHKDHLLRSNYVHRQRECRAIGAGARARVEVVVRNLVALLQDIEWIEILVFLSPEAGLHGRKAAAQPREEPPLPPKTARVRTHDMKSNGNSGYRCM